MAATRIAPSTRPPIGPTTRPEGAVVLGGDYRALGVVRSLGRRGVPVWVVREGDDALAAMSRYASRRIPWPTAGERVQVDYLLGLADEGANGWALIPTADWTAMLIGRHHEELGSRFSLTTPAWDTLRFAYDKRLTYALAEDLGLDIPRTLYPRDRRDLLVAELPWPVILKPAFKERVNRLTAAKAWRVDDRDALLRRYDEACTLVAPEILMVQELIPGDGEAQFSYSALCADGDVLVSLVAKRARQYPPDFGRASTYVETVDCAPVAAASLPLISKLRWTGLLEVEFKRDHRDGRFKLLDANPRVWGWHTLGARAGVDFPYLLWRAVRDEPVPAAQARTGVRWVRTTTDLPTVAREILRGRMSLRRYLRSLRGPLEGAIFARDDPGPAVAELPLLLTILVRRLLRGDAI